MRLPIAFLISPLIATSVVAPLVALLYWDIDRLGPVLFIGIFYGYPVLLVSALPAYLLIRSRTQVGMRHCIFFGIIAGLVIPTAIVSFMALLFGSEFWLGDLGWRMAALGALMGGFAGFSFWLVGFKGQDIVQVES